MTKRVQTRQKKEQVENEEIAPHCWTPGKMVDALLKEPGSVDHDWSEVGLPRLVETIVQNYETFGGMDHLEGKDLPSKKVVIEVLEDLLAIFFQGISEKRRLTKLTSSIFLVAL